MNIEHVHVVPDFIDKVISRACIEGASDIHIDPKVHFSEIKFRIQGDMSLKTLYTKSIHDEVVGRIKVLTGLRIDIHEMSQDGRFIYVHDFESISETVDVRVSIVPTFFGENIVLRILRPEKERETDLLSLGFTHAQQSDVVDSLSKQTGMILISGPTGSGKTTTVYSLIKLLVQQGRNIVTIEDPVEYVIPDVRQIQINEHIGFGFSNALRSILRQDPDVIVVGEIRDGATAMLAFQAALTGHLVLSTIHTEDSASVYARLHQLGVPRDMVHSLVLLISQRLTKIRTNDTDGLSGSYKTRTGVFEVIPVVDTKKVTLFQNTFPEYIRKSLQKQGVLLLEDRIRQIEEYTSSNTTHI